MAVGGLPEGQCGYGVVHAKRDCPCNGKAFGFKNEKSHLATRRVLHKE